MSDHDHGARLDPAVEAAAHAIGRVTAARWDDLVMVASTAVEAAAPLIAEKAWDDGRDAGHEDGWDARVVYDQGGDDYPPWSPNPYRAAALEGDQDRTTTDDDGRPERRRGVSETETPTRDEIQAAVDYGQTLAVRRILDALATNHPRRHAHPSNDKPYDQGYEMAMQVVKEYRVGQDEARDAAERSVVAPRTAQEVSGVPECHPCNSGASNIDLAGLP